MKRTRLADRVLPAYSPAEERANCLSHSLGAALGLAVLAAFPLLGALHRVPAGAAAGAVFGLSLLALYAVSSLYHGLSPARPCKKIFQILDHCMIFVLIAGSYTPFCLCLIAPHDPVLGWGIFGFVWGCALLGIVLNAIDLKRFDKLSLLCYLGMGWCIIWQAGLVRQLLGATGFALLLGGGVLYSLGAALYVIGQKRPYYHTVFHVFTLLGSVAHVLCVGLYVL